MTWRGIDHVSCQRNGINERIESSTAITICANVIYQSMNLLNLRISTSCLIIRSLYLQEKRQFCLGSCSIIVPFYMAILINMKKVAVVTRESPEEHPRNNLSRDTNVKVNADYILQVSQEIEKIVIVTKKLSQEFDRIKNRILGALSKLDQFLLNSQVRLQCRTALETSQNHDRKTRSTTRTVHRIVLVL